jgi:hypothetical protein
LAARKLPSHSPGNKKGTCELLGAFLVNLKRYLRLFFQQFQNYRLTLGWIIAGKPVQGVQSRPWLNVQVYPDPSFKLTPLS